MRCSAYHTVTLNASTSKQHACALGLKTFELTTISQTTISMKINWFWQFLLTLMRERMLCLMYTIARFANKGSFSCSQVIILMCFVHLLANQYTAFKWKDIILRFVVSQGSMQKHNISAKNYWRSPISAVDWRTNLNFAHRQYWTSSVINCSCLEKPHGINKKVSKWSSVWEVIPTGEKLRHFDPFCLQIKSQFGSVHSLTKKQTFQHYAECSPIHKPKIIDAACTVSTAGSM